MTPQELAQKLHSVPGRGCVVVTGAGIRAISDLFSQPGTSRTILEAQVPYARKALDDFVGFQADQHVSSEEAKLIAEAALKRARYLADDKGAGDDPEEQLFGVGCTAAIATDRIRRGEDRAPEVLFQPVGDVFPQRGDFGSGPAFGVHFHDRAAVDHRGGKVGAVVQRDRRHSAVLRQRNGRRRNVA